MRLNKSMSMYMMDYVKRVTIGHISDVKPLNLVGI